MPNDEFKTRLKEVIHKAVNRKTGYSHKFVVFGYDFTYFTIIKQKDKNCYTKQQMIGMLKFLLDNIFNIPMGTDCDPLPSRSVF